MRIASVIILMGLMAFSWGCSGGESSYKDREGQVTPVDETPIPNPNAPAPSAKK